MPYSRWTFRKGSGRNALLSTAGVVLAGVAIAMLVAHTLEQRNREERNDRFAESAMHIADDIAERMGMFEHGLRGTRGAVIAAGGEGIGRERFLRYSESREYAREFPGVLGFGYVQRVPAADEAAFLRAARADGAPHFQIHGFGEHDGDRFVVLYYRSPSASNTIEGLDMASEARRRATALSAGRSGRPTMTAPIMLSGAPVGRTGFLVMLPVYREGMPLDSPERRLQATEGWAFAPLTVQKLLELSSVQRSESLLTLTDTETPAKPFYAEPGAAAAAGTAPVQRELEIYGRRWLLQARPTPTFVANLRQTSPWLAAALIVGASLLLASLLYLYLVNRFRRDQVLRKQAELASLVSHSSEAIIAEDLHGRITHWNPAAGQIFGHAHARALGQRLDVLLSPRLYMPEEIPGMAPALDSGTALVVQEMHHQDGHLVYVLESTAPIFNEEDRIIGHSHFLRDVSERVLAQRHIIELYATLEHQVAERTSELARASALQSAILAHAGYAIVATDRAGLITLFNPAAEKLLGYRASELIGRYGTQPFIGHEELERRAADAHRLYGLDVPATFEAIAAASTLGRSDTSEWPYVSKEGRRIPVLLTLSTLRDEGDEILGYLAVAVDLTEQKLHEKQLRLAIDAAESANQSKSDFLANMSHEIRTPMNAILGMLYLLQRSDLPAASKEMVQKIDLSARSLLEIINDILDFSKIEAGRIELDLQPFDLGQLLDNIAGLMSNAINAKPVEMIVDPLPHDCHWVKGDALRLNQVLINLVGNAIKFTESGEVALSVRRFRDGGPNRVKLLFSVRDTGIGIPREKQEIIFSPFLQADTSTSRKYGGSGLGLTISRRLVELMGGQLEVDSTPGRGSEFYFAIPLETLDVAGGGTGSQPSPRVLIADDHQLVRDNLADIARGLGWQPRIAPNGNEALAAIEQAQEPFDIFLLDWRMPGLDGLGVARHIREQSSPDHHPIIVMVTAYERKLLEQQPGHRDVDAVMTKPVTASALHRAIATITRQAETGPRRSPGGENRARLAGRHLLLVDDSEINCEVAQRILQGEGARVDVAHDGEEALAMLERAPDDYQLVLMDVQMPLMDGYEATRRLRQAHHLAGLPVIALTAGAYRQQQEMALKAGMNGFIAKPFDVDELIAVIQQFLPPQDTRAKLEPATEAAARGWASRDAWLLDGARAQALWDERAPYQRHLLKLLQDSPDPAGSIAALQRQRKPAQAIAVAHKLRGSAGSLALTRLSAAAGALERALEDGGNADDELEALRHAMAATAEAIHDFIGHAPVESPPPPSPEHGLNGLLAALESDDVDRIRGERPSRSPARRPTRSGR